MRAHAETDYLPPKLFMNCMALSICFLNATYYSPVHKLLTHYTNHSESTQSADRSWRRLVYNPEHPVQ